MLWPARLFCPATRKTIGRQGESHMHSLFLGHNIYFVDLPLLIVLISLVYSATRFDEWGAILREALRWGFRLMLFLVAIGFALYLLDRIT
jgi:hypothetical protein